MPEPILQVKHVSVAYETESGPVTAVDNVSLALEPGEILGLVGESGSGKSTLAYAILRLLKNNAHLTGGAVLVGGRDLYALSPTGLRDTRWRELAMVFQAAMNALNPVLTIGVQLEDTIRAHDPHIPPGALRERVRELLSLVRLDPRVLRLFPHQLSGGMRQRVVIAIALALEPQVVVMDEPTTALDVLVQRSILKQVLEIQRRIGFAMLFISHDFSLVASIAQRVAVMYAGRVVEILPAQAIQQQEANHHPYTLGLMRAAPHLSVEDVRLEGIPGDPPDLRKLPSGCAFHPRCPNVMPVCRTTRPELVGHGSGQVACHLFRAESGVGRTKVSGTDGKEATPHVGG